jgi:predicted RNA-binding protein YlxR (DUF448 family)
VALDDKDATMRERCCIVTGDRLPETALVRFVADPDGNVVPDVAAKLPGRGLWVRAERSVLDRAIAKNLFSKAAKEPVRAGADLPERTVGQLIGRMAGDLGLARRAGQLVLGFDNVAKAIESRTPPIVLVEARDGSPDGRRKLLALAQRHHLALQLNDDLDNAELSVALGRENVIHAALKSGRLTDRLIADAGRLRGLRSAPEAISAGSTPARHERDE